MSTHGEASVPIPFTERGVWPGSREIAPVAPGSELHLTVWLRPRQGGELRIADAQAIAATPPRLRAYADRATLATRTDADPDDVERLRRYVERCGLKVVATRWRSVVVAGPVGRLIDAFGATVATFEDGGGRHFRHRTDALHVPPELDGVVRGIFGLHQWPRSRKLGALQRHTTPLVARDVAARYRFPDGDGSGQTIGVVQLDGIFGPSDFDQSMSAQGITRSRPIVRRVDDVAVAHEHATTEDLEAALDVQVIGSLAPGATIVVYDAPNDERGFLDAVREALFDTVHAPSVLSISYGWPESFWTPAALDLIDELFAVAALVGVSVFCSSGDNGAELDDAGKPHVVAPASSPFAMACGATVIADAGDEQAWSQSGGGFSGRSAAPDWQGVAGASASHYGATGRGVPDMAAQQHPGYYVVMDGTELAMGGTSAVAPMWAALTARINQQIGTPVGFFAPILYGRRAEFFGEILTGNNGTFEAGADWNPCTGLGVPNGIALADALGETSAIG